MSAGLSTKQQYSRIYNRLQALRRELHKVGVGTIYTKRKLVYSTHNDSPDGGFNISYTWTYASNGECAGFAYIYLVRAGVTERFGWQQPAGSFEQGIAAIKTYFGGKHAAV